MTTVTKGASDGGGEGSKRKGVRGERVEGERERERERERALAS